MSSSFSVVDSQTNLFICQLACRSQRSVLAVHIRAFKFEAFRTQKLCLKPKQTIPSHKLPVLPRKGQTTNIETEKIQLNRTASNFAQQNSTRTT